MDYALYIGTKNNKINESDLEVERISMPIVPSLKFEFHNPINQVRSKETASAVQGGWKNIEQQTKALQRHGVSAVF